MAGESESNREPPGDSPTPVQRHDDDPRPVPEDWLRGTEGLPSAERIDRLDADRELVDTLRSAGFEGRDWEYFSTELARYGMAVIGGWMRKGTIFEKTKAHGYGGLPELSRRFTDDEVDELTGETVSKALVHFRRDVLMKDKWDPRKGATLRTYFVGQCIIRFANIYRSWFATERGTQRWTELPDTSDEPFSPHDEGPEARAIRRMVAFDAIAAVKDPRVRKAMLWIATGLTQAEIATELSMTTKAVERMLANERARLKTRRTG